MPTTSVSSFKRISSSGFAPLPMESLSRYATRYGRRHNDVDTGLKICMLLAICARRSA